MIRSKKSTALILFILVIFAFFYSSCTIKKISKTDEDKNADEYSTWTKSGKEFDPVEYVDSIWGSQLIPAFEEKAVEVTMLFEALEKDKEGASKEYGLKKTTGATWVAFKVKGEAEVLEYDDSSMNGLLLLEYLPADGTADITLQIGPVIRKTAIRDSVDFIKFTDVGNQLQFASLADELNLRMKNEAVEPLDLENIEGRVISFYGAFKLEEGEALDEVVITPVKIEVKD